MTSGSIEDDTGRVANYEILEVHDYDGNVWIGGDIEDHLDEADRVFYSIDVGGDEFYRWVAGPFDGISDLESAIEDETEFYG